MRPTADRARQALFDILGHGNFEDFSLEDAVVLDGFCGSGALGLEALSRGARHAVFMDSDRAALELVRANVRSLGEDEHATLLLADATRPPKADRPCNLVLLDPPYGSGLATPALAALADNGWLAQGAIAVAEIGAREDFTAPQGFEVLQERKYGAGKFAILRYHGRG